MIRLRPLGDGIYGKVYEAKYPENETLYAVKRNYIDKTTDFFGSIREIDLMGRVNLHPFFIGIHNIDFKSPFNDIYSPVPDQHCKSDNIHFIMEKADKDMFSRLYNANAQILHQDEMDGYMVQLLLAIEYIHSQGIIHRDIKPANILLVKNNIKICDFGMSTYWSGQERQKPNVVTGWYRPPEVCLGRVDYTQSVDIWSLGCVFAEFLIGSPLLRGLKDNNADIFYNLLILFQNHFKEHDWINILSDVVKTLHASASADAIYDNIMILHHDYDKWWSSFQTIFTLIKSKLDEDWRRLITEIQEEFSSIKKYRTRSITKKHRAEYILNAQRKINEKKSDTPNIITDAQFGETIENIFEKVHSVSNNPIFLDLLYHMLDFNPKRRWNATECLNHAYFKPYREYINDIRNICEPKQLPDSSLQIIECNERKWMRKIVQGILNKKESYPWFTFRRMFHAVDMYDYYLAWASVNYVTQEQTEDMGLYHGKDKAIVRFYVCLYMSIKYFDGVGETVPFDAILNPVYFFQDYQRKAEEFEHLLIEKVFAGKIYRKTIFEVPDSRGLFLSEANMEFLLNAYCNHDECQSSAENLYDSFCTGI